MQKMSLACAALLALTACSSATEPAPSLSFSAAIKPVSAQQIAALPDDNIADVPTVRAYSLTDLSPLQGMKVTFTMYDPKGAATREVATTGNDGIARLTSWRLSSASGFYRVDAEMQGSVAQFRAYARGSIIARYYQTEQPNTISGDRPSLVLYNDGAYYFSDGLSGYPSGNYNASGQSFTFYIDPLNPSARFYTPSQYVWYTAIENGNRLTMQNVDVYDWDPFVVYRR